MWKDGLLIFFFLVEKEPDRVVGLVGRQELEQRLASPTNTLF